MPSMTHAHQHVVDKFFMPRHINKSEARTIPKRHKRIAEIYRHTAAFLLRQPIGIHPSQGANKHTLAMIDMTRSYNDHNCTPNVLSSASSSASLSRPRKSNLS